MAILEQSPDLPENPITALLIKVGEGDPQAEACLVPHIYKQLRRIAGYHMRNERPNHTLQPTALVHEAYDRLFLRSSVSWQNRAHFYATASHLMRHILVDHARQRKSEKRGGGLRQVTLEDANLPSPNKSVDILILHEAIEHLAQFDVRQARLVELHFFGGLTFEEAAEVLHVALRTVKRDWSMARAWLKGELSKES